MSVSSFLINNKDITDDGRTMRINHVIKENIFESIDVDPQDPYFEHWQREIHPLLMEVALAPEQIKQLFKSIENTASEQGSNRTIAGKAVDAAGEVSEKLKDMWYTKLGGALANSQPVKDFDAKWEDVKSKFAAKHPDIAKKLAKYGEFAKNNPTSHKFLLAIAGSLAAALGLAAAGGITAGITATGLGVGGATAIVNIADRLLKGEKASTAIGRGASAGIVAGLTAAAVTKISGLIKDTLANIQQGREVNVITINPGTPMEQKFNLLPADGRAYDKLGQKWLDAVKDTSGGFDGIMDPNSASNSAMTAASKAMAGILDKASDPAYQQAVIDLAQKAGEAAAPLKQAIQGITALQQAITPVASALAGQAAGSAGEKKESYYTQTRPLSEGQIYVLLKRVAEQQAIMEAGILDKAKQLGGKALGAVAKGAAAVGKQITTNATYPKLFAAWKLEGSPTDSEELKKFLTNYGGITPEVINKVYADMKIAAGPTAPDIEAVKKIVMGLPTDRKIRLMKYIQKQPAPAAA